MKDYTLESKSALEKNTVAKSPNCVKSYLKWGKEPLIKIQNHDLYGPEKSQAERLKYFRFGSTGDR